MTQVSKNSFILLPVESSFYFNLISSHLNAKGTGKKKRGSRLQDLCEIWQLVGSSYVETSFRKKDIKGHRGSRVGGKLMLFSLPQPKNCRKTSTKSWPKSVYRGKVTLAKGMYSSNGVFNGLARLSPPFYKRSYFQRFLSVTLIWAKVMQQGYNRMEMGRDSILIALF